MLLVLKVDVKYAGATLPYARKRAAALQASIELIQKKLNQRYGEAFLFSYGGFSMI